MHVGHSLRTRRGRRFAALRFRADPHGDRFFALRTLRRDGSTTSIPIWLAPRDGRWYAYTPGRSWKVTRLRRDPRVRVAPATFHGEPLGPWQSGRARILPREERHLATRALTAKYGHQFRLFRFLMLVSARRAHGGPPVGLEITLGDAPRHEQTRVPGRIDPTGHA